MNNLERITSYVEESFLRPLLLRPSVTDVSFNGEAIFYQDSFQGRKRSNIEAKNEDIGAFLRQIANMSEQQFSYTSPILDVSFSRYRLNAAFLSIGRVYEQKVYTFNIRVCHDGSAVSDDESFFPGKTKKILLDALAKGESIAIGGITGAGKTELQKYLLMNLPVATRVIVIDNIGELERCRADGMTDMTFWMEDDRFEDGKADSLIRNALRNNPDYIVLAESRGAEFLSALNCVMSGHPIITTIHAKDIQGMPYRMARLAMAGDTKSTCEDLLGDIYHHFDLLVLVGKQTVDGRVVRRISSIGRIREADRSITVLYEEKKRGRKPNEE